MPARRYRAPHQDGAILADPPVDDWPGLVQQNHKKLDEATISIGGADLRTIRHGARREILALAREYSKTFTPRRPLEIRDPEAPFLLSGHQPELSHPGVWVKNFALHGLAKKTDGIPLNLIVDHDTLKSTTIRHPAWDEWQADQVALHALPFDRFEREEPYEMREPHDSALFRDFPRRLEAATANWGFSLLGRSAWKTVVATPGSLAQRFTQARVEKEREWGCVNLELPVSWLAKTTAFATFVRHISANLPRFRDIYNSALNMYRQANRIRSDNHPAADLEAGELPFWGPHRHGRRQRATTATDAGLLRPRALTLTLFCRLFLGDFFIHGIGGGKYDEVTDQIIEQFFEQPPPGYSVLSATLQLPLGKFAGDSEQVRSLELLARDLYWNPQRHVRDGHDWKRLIQRKLELIENEPASGRTARREWYQALSEITAEMRESTARQRDELQRQLATIRQEAAANAILQRRDYSWILYPEATLRPFLQRFL